MPISIRAPELGQYLAIGPRVVVVFGETAYEIVEGDGQATVTLPDIQPPDAGPEPDGLSQSDDPPTPQVVAPSPAQSGGSDIEAEDSQSGFCTSILIAPMLMVGMVLLFGKRRWIQPK